MPEIGFRRHAQAGRLVVMKRTAAKQILALPLQLHAEAGHQALNGDFFL
jgi:hypothetical protein